MPVVGNSGNAATRAAEFIYSKGSYAYGGYPDIDDMIVQQARERDPRKREAILHRIQQLTIDRAMYLPIMDYRTLRGVGPRVAEHMLDGLNLVPFPVLEEMKMKDAVAELLQPRVEGVAQAVAEEVEAEDRDEDGEAGEERQPASWPG